MLMKLRIEIRSARKRNIICNIHIYIFLFKEKPVNDHQAWININSVGILIPYMTKY